jgi:leucyl aminopeptidase
MTLSIKHISKSASKTARIILTNNALSNDAKIFSAEELKFLKSKAKNNKKILGELLVKLPFKSMSVLSHKACTSEDFRKQGRKAHDDFHDCKKVEILNAGVSSEDCWAFVEGLALSNYQFLKYFDDAQKRKFQLNEIRVLDKKNRADEIQNLVASVDFTRDLVNEPVSFLNAVQLAKELEKMSKSHGIKVEVFNKKKIESLKMGGLLSVNAGSVDPPTFTIMEYKPAKPLNSKPYVLVGKGVVFDTGGLSLKPTANSMDIMKCDMGGAATVAGALRAVAANKLPLHIICLVPATDNRPGGNATAPGDVVKMYNGKTVEVLNTDAEGRMILADALSYSNKLKPELVIDAATLTGAAARAIGRYGIVAMGNAPTALKEMHKAGNQCYERIAEMPFWDEYASEMKSDIADYKNLGSAEGGAITAGKFLEFFTDSPYVHLDIAGPSWFKGREHYHPKGGTGFGVRLLYHFFKNKCQ